MDREHTLRRRVAAEEKGFLTEAEAREEAERMVADVTKTVDAFHARLAAAEAENKRLRAAVEFYARLGGATARAALEGDDEG